MYAFVNGEIIPYENAVLHISDLSVQRGYGIFDFLKVANGHAYFMDNYLDRFYHSASVMRMSIPVDREELKNIVQTLVLKNGLPNAGIKMVLTGGYSADGFTPADPNLVITEQELTLPSSDIVSKGVRIITHEYVRDIPEAKTINYTMGIWLLEKMRQADAFDVLYFKNDEVSEFPRSNFFIVRQDNTLVTPEKNVLHGITRKNVLTLARKRMQAEEATVTLHDVKNAKEAFITSTTKRIIPVVNIDGKPVGTGAPGSVAQQLLDDLIALENSDLDKPTKV